MSASCSIGSVPPKNQEFTRYAGRRASRPLVLPAFSDGLLPPYVGIPEDQNCCTPYRTTLMSVVERFGSSAKRVKILKGFVEYRRALRAVGVIKGVQWIDGSFVEDKVSPGDLDVVTFFFRPRGKSTNGKFEALLKANDSLFDNYDVKEKFHCDAAWSDLSVRNPTALILLANFWGGLFSHTKEDFRRKGFLQLPLDGVHNDDSEMLALAGKL